MQHRGQTTICKLDASMSRLDLYKDLIIPLYVGNNEQVSDDLGYRSPKECVQPTSWPPRLTRTGMMGREQQVTSNNGSSKSVCSTILLEGMYVARPIVQLWYIARQLSVKARSDLLTLVSHNKSWMRKEFLYHFDVRSTAPPTNTLGWTKTLEHTLQYYGTARSATGKYQHPVSYRNCNSQYEDKASCCLPTNVGPF